MLCTYVLIRNFKYLEKSYFEYEIGTLSVLNVPSKSTVVHISIVVVDHVVTAII